MKLKLILFLGLGLASASMQAQTPTWAEDVAPILYTHCTSCHHNGGIGGFSLMTYTEASVPYIDIPNATFSKTMPPWKPDPNYRHFKDENVLTSQQIQTLTDWVAGGRLEGNPANAPQAPVYNPTTQLSQIDQTIQCPSYTVSATTDEYRSFVIPAGNTSTVYVNAVEVIPGNAAIVHHVILYYDPTSFPIIMDQSSPGPGFESYGVGPINSSGVWLGGWAPGQRVVNFPSNMGFKVPANANFVVEVHYAPGSAGMSDSTKINLKYTTSTTGIREAYMQPFLDYNNTMTDGPLSIPANVVKTFHHQRSVPTTISLLGLFPHMHKVGSAYNSYAKKGTTIIPLIDIPKWDFHWQGNYTVQQPVKIDAGSTIYGAATFDNTTNNPDNPNNPPQVVTAGEHTTQEMMILILTYTNYQAGDENIILDSTMLNTNILDQNLTKSLSIYPNPAKDLIHYSFETPNTQEYEVALINTLGTIVEERKLKITQDKIVSALMNLQAYPAGVYFLRIIAGDKMGMQQFVKE